MTQRERVEMEVESEMEKGRDVGCQGERERGDGGYEGSEGGEKWCLSEGEKEKRETGRGEKGGSRN